MHAGIEAHITGQKTAIVASDISARLLFQKWLDWWTEWPGNELPWEVEVPLALTPGGQGRRIKSSGHRDYSDRKPGEITGTADAILLEKTPENIGHGLDIVTVVDWKTGQQEFIEPAQTNRQLGFLALAAARATGAQIARGLLVHIAEDGVTVDSAQWDAFDLDQIDEWISAGLARVPTSVPKPGDHCNYCQARGQCPAFVSASGEVSESSALAAIAKPGEITTDQIAKAWPQIRLIEAGLEQIKQRVRAHVEAVGSVPLLNGKHLRMVETSRENLSAASIKRAMGATADDVLSQLRQAGAIETSAVKSMREVKL